MVQGDSHSETTLPTGDLERTYVFWQEAALEWQGTPWKKQGWSAQESSHKVFWKESCRPTPACLHPVIGVLPLLDVLYPCTEWLSAGTGLL